MGCNCILSKSQNYKYHQKIQSNFNNPLAENYTLHFRSSVLNFSHLRKYPFLVAAVILDGSEARAVENDFLAFLPYFCPNYS